MKIIDDFFSEQEIQTLTQSVDIDYLAALTHYESSKIQPYTKSNLPTILKKIINLVNIDYKVVEPWVHDSKFAEYLSFDGLGRHSDCNEVLRDEKGIMEYPEKTFVYYLQVSEDFSGGELIVYRKDTD
ncbi:MAG: 2OG-Fe(II) oxygenase, partial [Flavobacteriia bacterium]|nr:2OG-Fe(II) oxygenase [Flavobacteriia bacterium]